MNYNYIFFSIDNEFYKYLYAGFSKKSRRLILLDEVPVINNFVRKLNGWRLPYPWIRGELIGRIFYYNLFRNIFSIEKERESEINCYIVYGRILDIYGPALFAYLKKCDKNAIMICYLGDVVSSFKFNIDEIKKKFGLVFSLDRKDALANGLLFLREPYSNTRNLLANSIPKYDVIFVGTSKNRLKKIVTIYEKLMEKGYKCKFYIVGVDDYEQVYTDDIVYNVSLSYGEVLGLINSTKCILEVLQEEADTTTTRFSEAMVYKKMLLTDSEYLRKDDDLPPNILCVDYNDWSCLDRISDKVEFDNTKWIEELSIEAMITTIEREIKEKLK